MANSFFDQVRDVQALVDKANEKLTPREEFEQKFGRCSDDAWQWLKEFCEKNYIPQPLHEQIAGIKISGNIYHPDDVAFIMKD